MKPKRVLCIADPHCGHVVGLTPPGWFKTYGSMEHTRFQEIRETNWNFYDNEVNRLGHIDLAIYFGDGPDGKGKGSGGTELLTTDRNVQIKMTAEVINRANADTTVGCFGTKYHTGDDDDWEAQLVNLVPGMVDIRSHGWVDVNGLVIDYKHKASRSATSMTNEHINNMLWAEHGEFPKADLILRGHVHHYHYVGEYGWLGMTLPALQGYGSKYGEREISKVVDFGLVHFDITDKDEYSWQAHILKLQSARQHVVRL